MGEAEVRAQRGQADDEAALAGLVNVTGHDDDTGLPCLCKRCLAAAPRTAEAAGMQFVRTFAIAGTRVLHFWSLAELEGERGPVRKSVAAALARRLAAGKSRARR